MTTLENIPRELTALPQWLLWRAEPRDNRVSKIPYRADGYRASSTAPEDWTTFDHALRVFTSSQAYTGIGFVFRAGGDIAGIDLDHVIGTDGVIEPWALRTVEAFDSYTEISVSGSGIHIICHGTIPDSRGHRRERVEMYDGSRYFTMTGKAYGKPRPLRNARGEIERLLAWMTREKGEKKGGAAIDSPNPQHTRRPTLDDDKLLHRAASAKNGYRFARLFRGDTSDYGGDDSRADIALLSMLLWWTHGDEARTDTIFRRSGLMRGKWERSDYRRRCFEFLRKGTI